MTWSDQWRSSEGYHRAMDVAAKRRAEIDRKAKKMDRLTVFLYVIGAVLLLFGTVIGPALIELSK